MSASTAKTAREFISIPYKINRSPTDLLKALSSTVELVGNAPHYSAIDDTLLSHQTTLDKKKHYLAKVSGIKAAKFMIQKYPQGFMKEDCVPHVPKFFPEKEFTEEELKYPSEDLIYSMMSWGKFRQAYDTYLKCKDLSIEVSDACKLTLLDFLSIHNSKEEVVKQHALELWFNESYLSAWELEKLSKKNMQSSWRKGAEAELMFEELNEKTAPAYCSLIKGMAKYLENKLAIEKFNEMKSLGLKPDLTTYNEIIRLSKYESGKSNKEKTDFIMQILMDIKNDGLHPNLYTFNNCLTTISSFSIDQSSIPFTLNILKEMEFLKIEPSLATWNSVISIFYPENRVGGNTSILPQIMNKVEQEDLMNGGLAWRDINDGDFFKNAIYACMNYGQNASCVPQLHRILMRNNNIKFLNKEYSINKYFEIYFSCLMKYDVPDVMIREWRLLTPYILSRGIKIVQKVIQYIVDYKCFEYVPEIWSSFVEGRFRRDKNFSLQTLDQFLSLMIEYKPPQSDSIDPLLSQYGSICEIMIKSYPYIEDVKKRVERPEGRPTYTLQFEWSAKMLSNFFIIASNANKIDLVVKEFDTFEKNQMHIPGELSEESLKVLFETFFRNQKIESAVSLLNLASSYQLTESVKQFKSRMKELKNLSEKEEELVRQLNDKTRN